jgi:hypothetical protein
MHDERSMYRHQWPALRQQLRHLCLGRHAKVLLETLCDDDKPESEKLQAAVDAWRQAILDELAQKTRAADAWPGWRAVLPLFADTERLHRAIASVAETIRDEYTRGGMGTLWHVLHSHFIEARDELDGAKKTRLQVWRRLDRIRHDLNRQRRRQGLSDCQHLPELVAHVLEVLQKRRVKDVPMTVEGVMSYFYEFDPAYTQVYDDELHSIETLQELTGREWQLDLMKCLENLPPELRQAIDVRFEFQPQPAFLNQAAWRNHYGYSPRTLRDRADRALELLRQCMGL